MAVIPCCLANGVKVAVKYAERGTDEELLQMMSNEVERGGVGGGITVVSRGRSGLVRCFGDV